MAEYGRKPKVEQDRAMARTGPKVKTPGSGRKKGTPNKKTLIFEQTLARLNFDPAEELAYCYRELKKIAETRKKTGNLSGAIVAFSAAEKTANDISQYVFPKKKAIEHTGEIGVRTLEDFMALADDDEDEE